MHKNLQLLLQTANSVGINTGGSASRCPPNLQSIAVAVEWCKDESLDVTARCIAYSMPDPCSKQCTERVRLVKERIKELKLLERPRLTVPIDRELVDEVRSKLKVSVAEAAAAVSKHGSNMKAALNEVREQLGLQASENDGVAVVSEAEGVSLYLSERSASGYMGVSRNASGKFFEARCAAGDRSGASRLIGTYDDAVSAAVAYAKFRDEQRQQKAEENGGVAGVEEEEEADADEEGMGNDSRSVVEIIEDHGDGGDGGRTQKWLVRFDSGPRGGGASSSSSSSFASRSGLGGCRTHTAFSSTRVCLPQTSRVQPDVRAAAYSALRPSIWCRLPQRRERRRAKMRAASAAYMGTGPAATRAGDEGLRLDDVWKDALAARCRAAAFKHASTHKRDATRGTKAPTGVHGDGEDAHQMAQRVL